VSSEESRSAAVERSNRSFRAFVAASAAVGAAAGALPVILAFAVLDVTRSAADLGLVLAVQAITSLGLSLLGGVVADRHALRHLLVGSVLLRLVVAAGFAAVLLAGWAQLWELLVVAVGYGIADSVYTPASSAVLPRLVATDRLTTANSTLTSSPTTTPATATARVPPPPPASPSRQRLPPETEQSPAASQSARRPGGPGQQGSSASTQTRLRHCSANGLPRRVRRPAPEQ